MRKSFVATLTIVLIVICALGINALSNDGKRKQSCQLPRHFENGKLRTVKRETRNMSIVPEGSVLQFKCDKQYVLRGPSRIACKGGTWSPSLPKCFANSKEVCDTCCTMPDFTNGQAITFNVATRGLLVVPENSVLQFSCDDGHELVGTDNSLCLQGTWLPGLPLCIRKGCLPPPLLEHGKIISITQDSIYPPGTNVSYECNEGYKIHQQSPLICRRVDKEWIWAGEVPRCQGIVTCEDPGDDSNGQRDGSCCQFGDVLSYSCIEEFEIIGPSAIVCTEGGIWNSTRPKCQPEVFCSVPEQIHKGKIIGKKHKGFYLPDDEIYIVCDEGYTVGNQSDYLYCEINGQWDEKIPECNTSVNCNMPEEPENGYIYELANDRNLTTFPYNFEINFVCHKGYRLIGNSWRSCGAYGWTQKAPVCEEIQCPDPGIPENGMVQGSSNNYSIGSIIEFGCYAGYQLLGSSTRVCMENGQWNGELSRCNKGGSYCPNPGTPIGGTKQGNRYDFGAEVTFHCNPGRIQLGSAHRICQRNGEWSGEETKCLSQYDFDDKRVVGARIKSLLTVEKLNQEVKVNNYMAKMESNDTVIDNRGHAIDLDHPGRLIFIFIFDVSGSVGERNFLRSIDFAKAMVKVIRVSEDGTRVGVITFSSAASTEFNPFDYNNMEGVLEALGKLEYKKGGTATSSALTLIKENMMPLSLEVLGKNSKIIVFLMTDGKANMAGDPTHDAKELKEIGVEIYCIGITGDRKMETLNEIATSKEEHVFILDSYDSMDWLVQQIVNDTVDYSQCGIRQWAVVKVEEEDARGRVVNGLAVTKSWPWMAVILFVDPFTRDSRKPSGLCGGSIVSPKWVLTAAHCMYDHITSVWRDKNDLIINLGIINLRDTRNAQERLVLRYIAHPSYDIKTFDNDIALIELNKPAKYNEFVRPVCLPPNEKDLHKQPTFYLAGQKAAVVGWGYDKALKESNVRNAHHVKESKWVVLALQSRETCADSLQLYPHYSFTEQMICAGGDGKDVCHGDSGGPMMQSLKNDIGEPYWTEVGVVSWGIGCAQPNTFGFYTKVSMFVDWIKKTIENK